MCKHHLTHIYGLEIFCFIPGQLQLMRNLKAYDTAQAPSQFISTARLQDLLCVMGISAKIEKSRKLEKNRDFPHLKN